MRLSKVSSVLSTWWFWPDSPSEARRTAFLVNTETLDRTVNLGQFAFKIDLIVN
jgi:hypothetical protein